MIRDQDTAHCAQVVPEELSTARYEAFTAELNALCFKHDVTLCAYDIVVVVDGYTCRDRTLEGFMRHDGTEE